MRRGPAFSLAEVVVSMFLLGLVFTAVLNLFPASLLMVDGTEARYQATGLAQACLEKRVQEPWAVLSVEETLTTQHDLDGRRFSCQVTVVKLSPSLCRLTSTASWQQKGVTWKVEETRHVSELRR